MGTNGLKTKFGGDSCFIKILKECHIKTKQNRKIRKCLSQLQKKEYCFPEGKLPAKCLIYKVEVATKNSPQIYTINLVKVNSNLAVTNTQNPSKIDLTNMVMSLHRTYEMKTFVLLKVH